MRHSLTLAIVCLAALPLTAQQPGRQQSQQQKQWSVHKTPWGDPDLQGSWTSDDTRGVPFERPANFGERRYLTEQELADRAKTTEQTAKRVLNPANTSSPARAQAEAIAKGAAPPAPSPRGVDVAPAPGNWIEFARRASRQTSQVIEPSNGKIPALTPEAERKLASKNAVRRRRPESSEDWSLYDRCITRGVAGSIIPVIYGNGLDITQAPGYVVIRYEMVHEARVIPTDNRPHAGPNVRSYMGDAVGHWEGNTLVVDTTNFKEGNSIGANGDGGAPTSDALHIIERFTPVAENTIDYEATIDDPKTFKAPWKFTFPITHEPGYQIFEYACHEGNMAMRNMLNAARLEDKADAATK